MPPSFSAGMVKCIFVGLMGTKSEYETGLGIIFQLILHLHKPQIQMLAWLVDV